MAAARRIDVTRGICPRYMSGIIHPLCVAIILADLELDKEHDETPHVIEAYKRECWHCGNCRISCPHQAVSFEFPLYTLV